MSKILLSLLGHVDVGKTSILNFFTKTKEKEVGNITQQIRAYSFDTEELKTITQNEKIGNYWRKRTKLDGVIDWRMSAKTIARLVHALSSPYDGATFIYNENTYKVISAKNYKKYRRNDEYGKVLYCSGSVLCVRCGEGALEIEIDGHIDGLEGKYL